MRVHVLTCPTCAATFRLRTFVPPLHCHCGDTVSPKSSAADLPEPIDRPEFRRRQSICKTCTDYGQHQRSGKSITGCGNLEMPCQIERTWLGEIDCPKSLH